MYHTRGKINTHKVVIKYRRSRIPVKPISDGNFDIKIDFVKIRYAGFTLVFSDFWAVTKYCYHF
jgi:hypothetical protein